MTEETTETEVAASAQPSALDMSDEAFLQMSGSGVAPVQQETVAETTEDAPEGDPQQNAGDDLESAAGEPVGQPETQETVTDPAEVTGEEQSTEKETAADLDYAAIGKQIMGEFKANGRTIKVKSAEDAIALMQMGANYHKKMTSLQPSLKTLKLLEKNNLLDPEKLSYLIDLDQKNPAAITRLLKESKLDPLDLNTEAESDYVPPNRTVSDTELQLDSVLESIQGTPTYQKTLNVVGQEWDVASRTVIAQNPEVIRVINDHVASGIFDQVVQEMEYQRSLGKLSGLTDFQAYKQIGEYMDANKLFAPAGSPAARTQEPAPAAKAQTVPDTSAAAKLAEANRQARKKAATSTRSTPAPVAAKPTYNPLEMSDEEFMRINKISY